MLPRLPGDLPPGNGGGSFAPLGHPTPTPAPPLGSLPPGPRRGAGHRTLRVISLYVLRLGAETEAAVNALVPD